MHLAIIALFDRYSEAAAAVRDLEIAGIAGGEVEVVSDVDRDERAEDYGLKTHDSIRERIARALRGLRGSDSQKVYDDSGDMPDYIGEQEFYATHVRKEGAVAVIRVPTEHQAGVAEAILKQHGAKTRDGKSGILILRENHPPETGAATGGA